MTAEELRILTWTLLGEAGGEGQLGQRAVAHVIRNRSLSGRFPDNPAVVAIQNNGRGTYQFSTWNPTSNGGNAPRARFPVGSESFNKAARIVAEVFGPKPGADPTRGATHYYSPSGMTTGKAPYWWNSEAKNGEVVIGRHIFATRNKGVAPEPRPVTDRPNGMTPVGQGTKFENVQNLRTGKTVGLPDLPASGEQARTFVYDPIQNKMLPKSPPASQLIAETGSAKRAQTYAKWETERPPNNNPGQTIALVDTRQTTAGKPQSYAGQERPQTTDRRVAGFVVPQGIDGIRQVDAARVVKAPQVSTAQQGFTYAGQDDAPRKLQVQGGPKAQDRLPSTLGLPPPRVDSKGLSRDALAAATAARGEIQVGKPQPIIAARPMPPLPQPRPAPQPSAPMLKVIVSGGNYGNVGGSAVDKLRAQGYSPSDAYDIANQQSRDRAIANSDNPEKNSARASLAERFGFD